MIFALSQGMVSLNFDDGCLSAYNYALPLLDRAGLKSTQYIITGTMNRDDMVNQAQILAMYAAGHEIGAHSRSHAHLSQLSTRELIDEVFGSKMDLCAMGIDNVETYAYPYGEINPTVKKTSKLAGFLGARGAFPEFNTFTSDLYQLKSHSIRRDTSFDTVKSWINQAVHEKGWLILVFHQIGYSDTTYSTTPEILKGIIQHLVKKNVLVITNAAGLKILSQSYFCNFQNKTRNIWL